MIRKFKKVKNEKKIDFSLFFGNFEVMVKMTSTNLVEFFKIYNFYLLLIFCLTSILAENCMKTIITLFTLQKQPFTTPKCWSNY